MIKQRTTIKETDSIVAFVHDQITDKQMDGVPSSVLTIFNQYKSAKKIIEKGVTMVQLTPIQNHRG